MATGPTVPAVNDWTTLPATPAAPASDWQTIPPAHQEALGYLSALQKSFDTSVQHKPDDSAFTSGVKTMAGDVGGVIAHPLNAAASLGRTLFPLSVAPGGQVGMAPSQGGQQLDAAKQDFQQNGVKKGLADLAGHVVAMGAMAGAGGGMVDAVKPFLQPDAMLPGQNYSPAHADAFEGAIAPATAMGKNFIPQNVTSEALSPIRSTAARMATGTPAEQAVVQSATSGSTSPLEKIGAYRSIIQNALQDLESQHAPALAGAAQVPVDVKPIIQELQSKISPTMDPADVSAIRNLMMRVKSVKTIGDLNRFRQELNIETAPEYRQSQIQAGRSGLSAQAASDLANSVRGSYYDALQQATGKDFAPLKRQEANLLTTQEALQNQAAPLAKAEATFNAPTTLREKLGNVANIIKDPKTTVTQTLLRESPATKTATLLQKSLQDLPTPSPAPVGARIAGLLQRPPIEMPGPADSSNPLSRPPMAAATTRAQRLGLLLPGESGGRVPLPYNPEMSGGEQIAALMQYLRRTQQAALPAKSSAIPLPPGS